MPTGFYKRGATLEERFWDNVPYAPDDGCWLWAGRLYQGAGRVTIGEEPFGSLPAKTRQSAPRVSWQAHHGDIPEGMSVFQKCRNNACVNPDHLFLGVRRTLKPESLKTMCKRGHSLDPANIRWESYVGSTGEQLQRRFCIKCQQHRNAEYRNNPKPKPPADAPKIPRGTLEKRFWAKVPEKPSQGCWEFSAIGTDGYGQLWVGPVAIGSLRANTQQKASRVSWQLHYGDIPEGLKVLHDCDNPKCVRPDHLFLGTAQDNSDDMRIKGRAGNSKKEFCPHGHAYSPENTSLAYYTNKVGETLTKRSCKQCCRLRQRGIDPSK